MANAHLEANIRRQKGKSYRKQLARRGMIPGVVYGKAVDSIPVEMELKPLKKFLSAGVTSLIDLTVKEPGKEDKHCKVLIKDTQYSTVKHELISVDLYQISLDNKIETPVPLNFTGAAGDGIVQYTLRELRVSCLPADIPREITVDINGLSVGDTIAVRDIAVPGNVEILDDPGTIVVTVMAQNVEEAPDADAEPEEGEPGEAGEEIPDR